MGVGDVRETSVRVIARGRTAWAAAAVLAFGGLRAGGAGAARIGLVPLMDDGAAGRTTSISGVNFEPSTTYTVLIGGFAVTPATVTSSAAGAIAATTLTLPALPGGLLDVTLASASLTRTFTAAFQVWRNVCLSPESGDGRPGQTWRTNAAIPTGGWVGMVLVVQGTGFAANAVVAANSITIGGAATTHPAIAIGADGLLPSTTVLVAAPLANGFKDLVVTDTLPATFTNAFEVRRSLGLVPARGPKAFGGSVTITGYGFTDGTIAANAIGIGGTTTTHPAVTVTNGAFSVNVILQGNPGGGSQSVITPQETFAGTYGPAAAPQPWMGIDPVTPTGLPNQAIQVQGTINWTNGTIAANSAQVVDATTLVNAPTVHAAITVAGGTFPPAWVVVPNPLQATASGLLVGTVQANALLPRRILSVCPILAGGAAGWTSTVTGYGFTAGVTVAANSITAGGLAGTHLAVTTTWTGQVGPLAVAWPALPNGDLAVAVNDGVGTTFADGLHGARTIGLSFVDGPGSAGDVTSLTGWGFAPGTIAANSILFNAAGTTHAAITVPAAGAFAATAVTLPALDGGPYNVTAQATFGQPYRVTNPGLSVAKTVTPPGGPSGSVATYVLSFTNAQWVGDPRAQNVVLIDTVPAGVTYLPGSTALSVAGAETWYHTGCACFTGVDTGGDVTKVRWALASPVAAGSSALASFRVIVQ